MKHRLPTLEERKLWLESNRETQHLQMLGIDPQEDDSPPAPSLETSTPTPVRVTVQRVVRARLGILSLREAAKRFRAFPIDATLDLHGETKLDARDMVQQFIHRQSHAHRRHVLIITGKGKGGVPGVLREYLPDWLNEPLVRPLISALAYAPPEKGGAGVMHVLLKAR